MKIDAARGLTKNVIFVLGSPRSGTSWLAKIIDSHPNVLYRHEPDEVFALRHDLPVTEQVAHWIAENRIRVATKAPFFQKSWLPGAFSPIHHALAKGLNAADRFKLPIRPPMPDFGAASKRGVRAALKLVAWDGSSAARALPDSRSLLILRHPCGQVSSHLRGAEQHNFLTDVPAQDRNAIIGLATSRGVGYQEFEHQPLAAKSAWTWLHFNEAILKHMDSLPNMKLVIYEQLCRQPEELTRELFQFVGLDWSRQTSDFIMHSTQQDQAGFYTVSRNSLQAAERWRTSMKPEDQAAVRGVISTSILAKYWADF